MIRRPPGLPDSTDLVQAGPPDPDMPYNGEVPEPKISREEAEATLNARKQLGEDYEPALVESFVERIDATIEARVDARVEQALKGVKPAKPKNDDHVLALAIVSLGVAIPMTAIAAHEGGMAGMLITWIGIVLVNFLYGAGRFRRD
ncbi:hypothetical protein GCM10023317_38120 [Actinopolymorpha pittospori]